MREASPGHIRTDEAVVDRHGDQPPATTADTTKYEGAGVAGGLIALLVVAALVVVIVGQNLDAVEFELLWWSTDVSLALLLLVTALVVVAIDQLVGLIWRRRRRRVKQLTRSR